jgi:hypothetical protein
LLHCAGRRGEIPTEIRYAPGVWRHSASGGNIAERTQEGQATLGLLQSKLDGAFAQYHNEVQDMQAKSRELVRMNKSLRQKNKGMPVSGLSSTYWEYPVVV